MNRFMRIATSIVSSLAASMLLVADTMGAQLPMTIVQSSSSLTLDGQLSGLVFVDQAAGSRITSYTGTITVDVDNFFSPTTISIVSASADADVNGTWLPLLGGQNPTNSPTLTPPAPGDYGVKAKFSGQDAAFAAARGVVLDMASGAETVGGGGLFTSSETVTVSAGVFDSWVAPALGGGGGQSNTAGDIYLRDATQVTQSSYVVSGNLATLTIPIRAKRTSGTSFTSFTGTLVATATVPEPTTFALLGTAIMASFAARRRR